MESESRISEDGDGDDDEDEDDDWVRISSIRPIQFLFFLSPYQVADIQLGRQHRYDSQSHILKFYVRSDNSNI